MAEKLETSDHVHSMSQLISRLMRAAAGSGGGGGGGLQRYAGAIATVGLVGYGLSHSFYSGLVVQDS